MNEDKISCIVVVTTCPTQREATHLVTQLLENRLAACVQTSKINSTYRWRGAIESADELQLAIKARASDYPEIESLIKSFHSYENPEIIAMPILDGSPLYLNWIKTETER